MRTRSFNRGDGDEGGERKKELNLTPKRERYERTACDACRKKKVRCQVSSFSCSKTERNSIRETNKYSTPPVQRMSPATDAANSVFRVVLPQTRGSTSIHTVMDEL